MNTSCPELERLREHAASTFQEARKIRHSRDVSVFEDHQMCREGRRTIYALIKHLLVGHEGSACPAGDRPIVGPNRKGESALHREQTLPRQENHVEHRSSPSEL
jgi:hypothetical protein